MAHVPELDVSSCGDTADRARRNVQDAVRGFLETAREMGTLTEILEEAGHRREGEVWRAQEWDTDDILEHTDTPIVWRPRE